eukprot:gene35216-43418_t
MWLLRVMLWQLCRMTLYSTHLYTSEKSRSHSTTRVVSPSLSTASNNSTDSSSGLFNSDWESDTQGSLLGQYLECFLDTKQPVGGGKRGGMFAATGDVNTQSKDITSQVLSVTVTQHDVTPLSAVAGVIDCLPEDKNVSGAAVLSAVEGAILASDTDMPALMSGTVEDNEFSDSEAMFPLWPAPPISATGKRNYSALTDSDRTSRPMTCPPVLTLFDGRRVRVRTSNTTKFAGMSAARVSLDDLENDLKALPLIASQLSRKVGSARKPALSETNCNDAVSVSQFAKETPRANINNKWHRLMPPSTSSTSVNPSELLDVCACDNAVRQDLMDIAVEVDSSVDAKYLPPPTAPQKPRTFFGPQWTEHLS